jgi:hypothetical protein
MAEQIGFEEWDAVAPCGIGDFVDELKFRWNWRGVLIACPVQCQGEWRGGNLRGSRRHAGLASVRRDPLLLELLELELLPFVSRRRLDNTGGDGPDRPADVVNFAEGGI